MAIRLAGLLLLSAALLAPASEGAERAKGKAAKADLDTSAVSAPDSATTGASITVGFTIRNKGRKTAKASTVEFALSKNGIRDSGDTLLATAAIKKLKRKATSSGQVQLTVPATPGAFLLLACADAKRKVKEKSESNNCRTSDAFTIAAAEPASPVPGPLTWSLKNANSAGAPDLTFDFGTEGEIPITGDWDGNGTDTPGTFDPDTNLWSLRNSNSAGAPSATFSYGPPGALPVTGDWDGDGDGNVGYYEPSTGTWGLRTLLSGGTPDLLFSFGGTGALTPITGDWNGNAIDSIGSRFGTQRNLRNLNSSGPADLTYAFGAATDVPLAGDWNNDNTDSPGFFAAGTFGLRNANSAGAPDVTFAFGDSTGTPVAGDWNGNGDDTVGVVR